MGCSYLTKRGQQYYFRMRVPADLFSFLQQKFITVSLRTRNYKQAKRRLRVLVYKTEELFTTIRMDMLSDEQIAQLVQRYKDRVLAGYERQREHGSDMCQAAMSGDIRSLNQGQDDLLLYRQFAEDRTEEDYAALLEHYQAGIKARKELRRYGHFDDITRISAYSLAEQSGQDIDLPPKDYLNPNEEAYNKDPPTDFYRLVQAMVRTEIDILEIEVERLRCNDTEYDRELRRKMDRPNKLLSEVCALIEAEQAQNNKKTSLIKVQQNHKALLRVLVDKPIRDYDEQEILKAGEIIRKWPKGASSRRDLDHMSAEAIVNRTDLGEPIKMNSIKYRLTGLNSIFKKAAKKGWIDRNPCPTWKFKVSQEVNEEGELESQDRYLPWSIDEILRLLQTSYFTKAKHCYKNAENYWLPIIAILSGCRQSELCQLYCDDIRYDDKADCWFFRIVIDGERRQGGKTEGSVRRVPVHQTLIELGLLNYREFIAQGHDRLFPNLTYYATVDNWSNGFSKRFGKHIKRVMEWDDPEQAKVFHGFRSSFINTLRDRNGVLMEQSQYLTGHAPQLKMPALYAGRPKIALMNDYIQRLDYGIDFVELLGRWEPQGK